MTLQDRIKQQSALMKSIGHWEDNKKFKAEWGCLISGMTDADACSLCQYNELAGQIECYTCILEVKCSRTNKNPWKYKWTDPERMINYLKLHQLHSDILIEPGIS